MQGSLKDDFPHSNLDELLTVIKYTDHSTDNFISCIHGVNFNDVITKVQSFEAIFLSQQSDQSTPCPVEAFTKALPASNSIQ